MKLALTALALTLGLVPALSEAAVVCKAIEGNRSTMSATQTVMRRQRPTLGAPTRQWGHKSPTFKYQVIAVGPEGDEDIYLTITSVELPYISAKSPKLRVLANANDENYQLQMTVDRIDGHIICTRN